MEVFIAASNWTISFCVAQIICVFSNQINLTFSPSLYFTVFLLRFLFVANVMVSFFFFVRWNSTLECAQVVKKFFAFFSFDSFDLLVFNDSDVVFDIGIVLVAIAFVTHGEIKRWLLVDSKILLFSFSEYDCSEYPRRSFELSWDQFQSSKSNRSIIFHSLDDWPMKTKSKKKEKMKMKRKRDLWNSIISHVWRECDIISCCFCALLFLLCDCVATSR